MPIPLEKGLESWGRMLIPFAGPSDFVGLIGERVATVRGEIDLAFIPGNTQVSLFRFGLTSAGIALGEGGAPTGHFGARGIAGLGTMKPLSSGTWALHLDFLGVQFYEELTRRAGRTYVPPDRFMAPMESFAGILDGVVSIADKGVETAIVFSGRSALIPSQAASSDGCAVSEKQKITPRSGRSSPPPGRDGRISGAD